MPTMSAAFLPLNDSTGEFEISLTGVSWLRWSTELRRCHERAGYVAAAVGQRRRTRRPQVSEAGNASGRLRSAKFLGIDVVDEVAELLDHLLGLLLVGLLDPSLLVEHPSSAKIGEPMRMASDGVGGPGSTPCAPRPGR